MGREGHLEGARGGRAEEEEAEGGRGGGREGRDRDARLEEAEGGTEEGKKEEEEEKNGWEAHTEDSHGRRWKADVTHARARPQIHLYYTP